MSDDKCRNRADRHQGVARHLATQRGADHIGEDRVAESHHDRSPDPPGHALRDLVDQAETFSGHNDKQNDPEQNPQDREELTLQRARLRGQRRLDLGRACRGNREADLLDRSSQGVHTGDRQIGLHHGFLRVQKDLGLLDALHLQERALGLAGAGRAVHASDRKFERGHRGTSKPASFTAS